jgi:hypothetical protein
MLAIIAPKWLDNTHFDHYGKSPKGVPDNQLKPMLQALLKDRFQLKEHHEEREMAVLPSKRLSHDARYRSRIDIAKILRSVADLPTFDKKSTEPRPKTKNSERQSHRNSNLFVPSQHSISQALAPLARVPFRSFLNSEVLLLGRNI